MNMKFIVYNNLKITFSIIQFEAIVIYPMPGFIVDNSHMETQSSTIGLKAINIHEINIGNELCIEIHIPFWFYLSN